MLEEGGGDTGEERTEGTNKKRTSIIAQLLPTNLHARALGSSI